MPTPCPKPRPIWWQRCRRRGVRSASSATASMTPLPCVRPRSPSHSAATTVATDTAQIILMKGNLNQLLYVFRLAKDFERNLKQNVRYTTGVSAVAISGILLAGFTFAATEVFYALSLFGGLVIAMKPLLERRKRKEKEGTAPANRDATQIYPSTPVVVFDNHQLFNAFNPDNLKRRKHVQKSRIHPVGLAHFGHDECLHDHPAAPPTADVTGRNRSHRGSRSGRTRGIFRVPHFLIQRRRDPRPVLLRYRAMLTTCSPIGSSPWMTRVCWSRNWRRSGWPTRMQRPGHSLCVRG